MEKIDGSRLDADFISRLRSMRGKRECPAGNFGELNSFDRLDSTGCPNKRLEIQSF